MASTTSILDKVKETFIGLYKEEPVIVRSPGRVNIIGEHTDYNEGFVLPAAIDKAIYIAINKRPDEAIHLYAGDYSESYESSSDRPDEGAWRLPARHRTGHAGSGCFM